MKQLHQIQLKILKELLFVDFARYMDLKPEKEMENNQFDFHLHQLIEFGYVQKVDKKYCLTQPGKEYANRIDTDKVIVSQQAKIGVFICCVREVNNVKEFLLITRKKQPFYNCQGFMSGKVSFGEYVVETARRELLEESDLAGEPVIVSVRHYRVFNSNKELIEDKFIYYCRVDNPVGEIVSNGECEFEWVREDRLKEFVVKPVESFEAFKSELDEINDYNGVFKFKEIDYISLNF